MDLYGSNLAYGTDEVSLGEARRVLPVSADEARFPCGVGGLLPVSTMRKKGEKVVYAFPVGDADGDGPSCLPGTQDVLDALQEAVGLVNRMLDQAAELAHYDFGFVGGIQAGVPQAGWGFTRVEVVPKDAHGQPSASPLHLCVETVDDPGMPDSLSAVVEYAPDGTPLKLTLTEFGDRGDTCHVVVTPNEKTGKLSVAKVEQNLYLQHRERLLYKRGQPRYEFDGRGGYRGRDDRRGRGGAGRDDRRGGWDR